MEEKDIHNANFPRKLPFTVPEEYFEQLPSEIQMRRAEISTGRSTMSILRSQLAFVLGFVALVAAGYTGYYFAGNGSTLPVSDSEYFGGNTQISDNIMIYDMMMDEYEQTDSIELIFTEDAEEYLVAYGFDYSDLQ